MNIRSRFWYVVKGTLIAVSVLVAFVFVIYIGGAILLNGPAGTYVYTGQINRLEYSQNNPNYYYIIHLKKVTVNGCDLTTQDPCVKKARDENGFAIPLGTEKDISLFETVSIKCVVSPFPFDIHNMMSYIRGPDCQLVR